MKKTLLLTMIAALFAVTAHAQLKLRNDGHISLAR